MKVKRVVALITLIVLSTFGQVCGQVPIIDIDLEWEMDLGAVYSQLFICDPDSDGFEDFFFYAGGNICHAENGIITWQSDFDLSVCMLKVIDPDLDGIPTLWISAHETGFEWYEPYLFEYDIETGGLIRQSDPLECPLIKTMVVIVDEETNQPIILAGAQDSYFSISAQDDSGWMSGNIFIFDHDSMEPVSGIFPNNDYGCDYIELFTDDNTGEDYIVCNKRDWYHYGGTEGSVSEYECAISILDMDFQVIEEAEVYYSEYTTSIYWGDSGVKSYYQDASVVHSASGSNPKICVTYQQIEPYNQYSQVIKSFNFDGLGVVWQESHTSENMTYNFDYSIAGMELSFGLPGEELMVISPEAAFGISPENGDSLMIFNNSENMMEAANETYEIVFYKKQNTTLAKYSCNVLSVNKTAPNLIPSEISLGAYPNPFNGRTVISFTLERAGKVKIDIFDITGRTVGVQYIEPLQAGMHEFVWDAAGCASGVYFIQLIVDGRQSMVNGEKQTRKVILLK